MYDYAQALNGIAVGIEHRYFGLSTPFGNASYTVEAFQYLTLENVMLDVVELVRQIRENVTGSENSPVIVASGSYGGFLATAFRMNHPETIYGSIASAAPVEAFASPDFDANSPLYHWFDWVCEMSTEYEASC